MLKNRIVLNVVFCSYLALISHVSVGSMVKTCRAFIQLKSQNNAVKEQLSTHAQRTLNQHENRVRQIRQRINQKLDSKSRAQFQNKLNNRIQLTFNSKTKCTK